jgi:hypothetical protein
VISRCNRRPAQLPQARLRVGEFPLERWDVKRSGRIDLPAAHVGDELQLIETAVHEEPLPRGGRRRVGSSSTAVYD